MYILTGFRKQYPNCAIRCDILLVVDEIATGFGRLGNMVEYLAQDLIQTLFAWERL